MIQIKQAFNTTLNKHYECPKGVMGRIAGEVMVRQHRPETDWTLHLLDIQPTDTVLEVGFGAGRGIKLAASKVNDGRIVGIDLSEEMVRVATRRNIAAVKAGCVALLQGDITALPFEDQYFDKIMTIHTLYFWTEPHEPSQALNELWRVLKPGGRLVITLSTGKINAQGEVEVWEPLQSALEKQVIPDLQRKGFRAVRLEQGPTSRQYTSVAVVGEK
ncbi:MAG TPA: class I SAM-dependent methyltransferase [Ktedonobacteraceae bacterium]